MPIKDFFEKNEEFLSEELRLLYILHEKPHQKVCTIDYEIDRTCDPEVCSHAEKLGIKDPEEDKCKYWIEIEKADSELKEDLERMFISKRRSFKSKLNSKK